jgi:hypothetical protein
METRRSPLGSVNANRRAAVAESINLRLGSRLVNNKTVQVNQFPTAPPWPYHKARFFGTRNPWLTNRGDYP